MRRIFSVLPVLDIIGRMWNWTDEQMNIFLRWCFIRKIDFIRFFLNASWGKQTPSSQPFMKDENGVFYFHDQNGDIVFNPYFLEQLHRLSRLAGQWKISLIGEAHDHCSTSPNPPSLRKNHPYYNNSEGIKGLYDLSPKAVEIRNALENFLWLNMGKRGIFYDKDMVGHPLKPNRMSLVNEGFCQKGEARSFGEFWAYPLAHQLRVSGYKGKIMFSAHEFASHAISGYVSTEGDWKSEFRKGSTINQLHGLNGIQWVRKNIPGVQHMRWFGVSDDGVQPNGASIRVWVDCLKEIFELCKEPYGKIFRQRYIDHYEILLHSISEPDQCITDLSKEDMAKFTQVRIQVFNDPNPLRKVPKWLNKRTGL